MIFGWNTAPSMGSASIPYFKLRVPSDLPQMVVRVFKVTCVTTPKCIVSLLYDNRARGFCLLHDGMDFLL